MAMGELSQPFTDQKNPAVASKCQRMVLKRANDQWESTHIPSSCSIVNDPEEDAVKVCKEAFPSLYVIGVRPIGQELLSGPWCKSNHKDWNKPCKGKPHLAPVWECLVKSTSLQKPTEYRKEIRHEFNQQRGVYPEESIQQLNDEYAYARGDEMIANPMAKSTKEIKTTPTTTTEPTTTTTTTSTTTTSTTSTTSTSTMKESVATQEEPISDEDSAKKNREPVQAGTVATGPPALSVPPMCSFRHTQRAKNETCKDAAEWRDDAIETCSDMKFELHSFAPLSTCDNNPDMYIGLQFVCCPADGGNGLNDGGSVSVEDNEPIAMAIKANNDIQVSRVELQSSPSVAAAAIAVGAAVVLLLTALAVVTVRGRQRVRRERRLANQRPPLSPEERHLQRLQSTGYENPTYRFFEQRQ